MSNLPVKIFRISEEFDDLPLPTYMTEGSAGMDVYAAVNETLVIKPMSTALVPTNLKIELPTGYEAQIRPRSGLAVRNKIILPNSPGTIDSDYRGEIKVIMLNLGAEPFEVNRGDRIAQMVISPYDRASWEESDSLGTTPRGEGGFGSTGK
ncbi:MAG: dUTP diphosphatase [Bacteroidetes bacterium]|nr:dUTP diphosphatase [Bacteroidota bacterium]MCL5034066.1 dUTP diphosphatase [Bacteroidota bacterium]